MSKTLFARRSPPTVPTGLTRLMAMAGGLCVALVLAGCGGGGDVATAPNAVQVDSARTARVTLGTAGGSVTAVAADGRRYTLSVPPGALAAATEITATPIVSMGSAPLAAGLKGAVRFGPSGQRFALPATLRIDGASATTTAGSRLVGFNRSEDGQVMRLIRPDTRGGALDLPVFHFSDLGVVEATEAAVANVPPAPPSQIFFERMHDILARESIVTVADAHAVLTRIFDQIVKPALDAGTASTDTRAREQGVLAYDAWLRAFAYIDVALNPATLSEALARALTSARPQAAGLIKVQFESNIDFCISNPQNVGFEFAMGLRQQAHQLDLAAVEFGLAPADTLRRVNDCVRLVIDPVNFPASVTVGTPRSLDAKASLIFASAPQQLAGEPVEFTVTSDNATVASRTGLSDQQGRYTVVVTPRVEAPVFTLKACYLLDPQFHGGGTTDLCTTLNAPDRPTVAVSLSGVVTATVQITATLRGNRDRVESLDGLNPVFDTTSETVDVALSYGVNMPVPAGTVVQPGARTDLSAAAVANPFGTGQARVNTLLEPRISGSCVKTSVGTASTTVTLASPQASGKLELTSDGRLGITIGGLQGTYVTTSAGTVSGTFGPGCSVGLAPSFSNPFGPRSVASDFLSLPDARATTALPDRGNATAASSTVAGETFATTSQCNSFLREHLRQLAPRLLSSEHIVSCKQQTTLSWQLRRE